MPAPHEDRCGARLHRRPGLEADANPVADGDAVGLTPLGRALMESLRDDERYRDIISDPFQEDAAGTA